MRLTQLHHQARVDQQKIERLKIHIQKLVEEKILISDTYRKGSLPDISGETKKSHGTEKREVYIYCLAYYTLHV